MKIYRDAVHDLGVDPSRCCFIKIGKEAEHASSNKLRYDITRHPVSFLSFSYLSRCARAAKDVHDQVTRIGQETNEKLWYLSRKARRMRVHSHGLATTQVLSVALGIGDL